jgi:23S rRNA-/tRNA-specific pseudouridylate synthase
LHAQSLSFNHPTTKEAIQITASPPETFLPFL